MKLGRRSFLTLASGLLVPHEPERVYSFAGGWSSAIGSVFVNGVWRAWVTPDRRADRLVEWQEERDTFTHDVPYQGTMHTVGPGRLCTFECVWDPGVRS